MGFRIFFWCWRWIAITDEMWKVKQWDSIDQSPDPTWFMKQADSTWFVKKIDVSRKEEVLQSVAEHYERLAFLELQEGHKVLDVGCGTGIHCLAIAHIVGRSGFVVGVDYSETMIREAQRHTEGAGLPLEYQQGDAHRLDFEDNSFDRVWANNILEHLHNPRKALQEMVRVVRPGGLIASYAFDWETQVIDVADFRVAQKITNLLCDSFRNGRLGRQVQGLFRELGLTGISVTGILRIFNDSGFLERLLPVGKHAVEIGVVTEAEWNSFLGDLRQRVDQNRLFASVSTFRVIGRNP